VAKLGAERADEGPDRLARAEFGRETWVWTRTLEMQGERDIERRYLSR